MKRMITLEMSDDLASAPSNEALIVWGSGGYRFNRRDPSGQWRNMYGHPKQDPRFWGKIPGKPEDWPE